MLNMTVTTNFGTMRPCFNGYPFQGKWVSNYWLWILLDITYAKDFGRNKISNFRQDPHVGVNPAFLMIVNHFLKSK